MRLTFLFIYISFIVSAKKHKSRSTSSEESEEYVPSVDTVLDLRGGVRKLFALEAALIDHARNMICSPLSVLMPLGKLALGAEKKAQEELLAALGLERRKQIKESFGQLITNMEYLPGVTLDVASRVYISTENKINKKFMKRTRAIFKSSCQKISTKDPTGTAHSINKWVSQKTRNKINKLINPSDIKRDTSLILVNAIYFAGNWKDRFGKAYPDEFHSFSGKRRIPMMRRQGQYKYFKCEALNIEVIEIPYEGEAAAMMIVLPYDIYGLPTTLRALKLAPDLFNSACLDKMKMQIVMLSMPKFKIETELDLVDLYQKIGVRSIFDKQHSDLTKIIRDEKVYVSKAIHKAVIEVNERGTEAAAATGINIEALKDLMSLEFKANRPFLFFIRAYKQQLFAGIFSNS